MADINCKEALLSNDYYDFIVDMDYLTETEREDATCQFPYNDQISALYYESSRIQTPLEDEFAYITIPKCFSLMDANSFEQNAVYIPAETQVLGLQGKGVLIGFIDTGIRYDSRVFRNSDGTTRIEGIWDQTIQTGNPPEGFIYGIEYSRDTINQALGSDNPLEVVPSTDENGHGTYLASVAAGFSREDNFIATAPQADIAVVKLKEAKDYLKEFYLIRDGALVYQENDIMFAMKYLYELSLRLDKPLVICIGLGSSMGSHSGQSYIAQYIDYLSTGKHIFVIGTGDEANSRHHQYLTISAGQDYADVEVQVDNNNTGFWMELWGTAPDIFTLSVTSPSGDTLPRVPYKVNETRSYTFLLEGTTMTLYYISYGIFIGNPLIIVRMEAPADGIWKFRIYGSDITYGNFNMWLPITDFIEGRTFFLSSTPDTTLVEPSAALRAITTSAYNTRNNSIYIQSGRGYTSNNLIKPDFAAPGVGVPGIGERDRTVYKSGTSSAAAITAGSIALLLEWAVVNGNDPGISVVKLKSELVRSAKRSANRVYPNKEWGYGALDLYKTFENFRLL